MLVDATRVVPSSRSSYRDSLYEVGRQAAHETRRLAKLAAGVLAVSVLDPRAAPGQVNLYLRA